MGLELISRFLVEQVYENNAVIFKEGDESEYIYFVMSGEVKLFTIQEVTSEDQQNKQIFQSAQSCDSQKIKSNLISQEDISKIKYIRKQFQLLPLQNVTIGQYFGEYEIVKYWINLQSRAITIQQLPKRETRAVAQTLVKVKKLARQQYIDNLKQFGQHCSLEDFGRLKDDRRQLMKQNYNQVQKEYESNVRQIVSQQYEQNIKRNDFEPKIFESLKHLTVEKQQCIQSEDFQEKKKQGFKNFVLNFGNFVGKSKIQTPQVIADPLKIFCPDLNKKTLQKFTELQKKLKSRGSSTELNQELQTIYTRFKKLGKVALQDLTTAKRAPQLSSPSSPVQSPNKYQESRCISTAQLLDSGQASPLSKFRKTLQSMQIQKGGTPFGSSRKNGTRNIQKSFSNFQTPYEYLTKDDSYQKTSSPTLKRQERHPQGSYASKVKSLSSINEPLAISDPIFATQISSLLSPDLRNKYIRQGSITKTKSVSLTNLNQAISPADAAHPLNQYIHFSTLNNLSEYSPHKITSYSLLPHPLKTKSSGENLADQKSANLLNKKFFPKFKIREKYYYKFNTRHDQ